jgi:hypothetical protein
MMRLEVQSTYGLDSALTGKADNINRWVTALVFLLALAFNWPYLTGGFFADDFILVNVLASGDPPISPWLGAWITTEVPAFENLWWKDGALAVSFFRPLPSLVLAGLVALFGKNPLPMHAFSVLMHGLVSALVFILAFGLTGKRSIALVAGLLFGIGEDQTVTVAWISTVTDILCAFGTLLSLIFHLAYLRRKQNIFLIGSIVSLIAALASKETAAVAPLALILLTLLNPFGSRRGRVSSSRLRVGFRLMVERPLTWVPQLMILIVYAVFYAMMGFGAGANLQYISPISTPGAFLGNVTMQLPVLILGTLTIWPPFVSGFDVSILPYLVLPGATAFALWVAGLWPLRRRAVVVWAMLTYLLATLPHMCTSAGERGLYLPMAVGSVLLALPILSLTSIARRLKAPRIIGTRWTRITGRLILFGALIPGIFITTVRPWLIVESYDWQEAKVRTAAVLLGQRPVEHLVVTNTSDIMLTYYFQDILKHHIEDAPNVWLLSSASGKFDLKRTGESSFVIRTDGPGWINNTMGRYARANPVVRVGQTYQRDIFKATIEEVTADGKDVLAVRFDFSDSEETGPRTFMTWQDGGYKVLDLDTVTVGATIELSPYRSLWESSFFPGRLEEE